MSYLLLDYNLTICFLESLYASDSLPQSYLVLDKFFLKFKLLDLWLFFKL